MGLSRLCGDRNRGFYDDNSGRATRACNFESLQILQNCGLIGAFLLEAVRLCSMNQFRIPFRTPVTRPPGKGLFLFAAHLPLVV